MAKKIRNKGKTEPPVRHSGKKEPKVGKEIVALALGAGRESSGESGSGASAHIFFVMRQEIKSRLQSSGGRPRLEGTSIRPKIPLAEEDWDLLKEIADLLRRNRIMATPGQVASVLVHQSLAQIDMSAIEESFTSET